VSINTVTKLLVDVAEACDRYQDVTPRDIKAKHVQCDEVWAFVYAKAKAVRAPWSWAALMHRAFAIDVLECSHCGGRLRLIATLHDPAVIRKLLAHLGIARSGPSPGPAPPVP
jgi:hypothetical protein